MASLACMQCNGPWAGWQTAGRLTLDCSAIELLQTPLQSIWNAIVRGWLARQIAVRGS